MDNALLYKLCAFEEKAWFAFQNDLMEQVRQLIFLRSNALRASQKCITSDNLLILLQTFQDCFTVFTSMREICSLPSSPSRSDLSLRIYTYYQDTIIPRLKQIVPELRRILHTSHQA